MKKHYIAYANKESMAWWSDAMEVKAGMSGSISSVWDLRGNPQRKSGFAQSANYSSKK